MKIMKFRRPTIAEAKDGLHWMADEPPHHGRLVKVLRVSGAHVWVRQHVAPGLDNPYPAQRLDEELSAKLMRGGCRRPWSKS